MVFKQGERSHRGARKRDERSHRRRLYWFYGVTSLASPISNTESEVGRRGAQETPRREPPMAGGKHDERTQLLQAFGCGVRCDERTAFLHRLLITTRWRIIDSGEATFLRNEPIYPGKTRPMNAVWARKHDERSYDPLRKRRRTKPIGCNNAMSLPVFFTLFFVKKERNGPSMMDDPVRDL